MRSKILAVRAIGSRYVKRAVYPVFGYILIGAGVLVFIIGLLANYLSDWWWLAAIPVGIIGLAVVALWLIIRIVLNFISPALNSSQTRATDAFVDKFERLLENATTPYPLLMARLVVETILRRKDGLITEFIGDSKDLRSEFNRLVDEFEK